MNESLSLDHQNLLTQINQGLDALSKNNRAMAMAALDQLPQQLPDNEEVLNAASILAFNLEQHAVAIKVFSSLVVLAPTNTSYLIHLAVAYINSKRPGEAFHLLQRVLTIEPDNALALANIGKIYVDAHEHEKAVEFLERACKNNLKDATLLINLAVAYNHSGRPEDALKNALKAKQISPNRQAVNQLIGMLKLELGDAEEAIKYHRKEIKLFKAAGNSYWGIASAKKATETDKPFIQQMELQLKESMPAAERSLIHFAAAKMYDDLKLWDKAFEHYRLGNILHRNSARPELPRKFMRQLKKCCTLQAQQKSAPYGSDTDVPVFILGLPRTGSTLTEQIISSHPDARSAGEMTTMSQIVTQIFSPDDKPLAEIKAQLANDALNIHATHYLSALRSQGRENALRIIDKSPGNFYYIGFILLLFPNARFIHTTRHPLDTILSNYFQPFSTIKVAQDLDWLADAYCFYRECMAYWHNSLPEGRILDVAYEDLIADPEAQSRRIMQHCDLEWRPECLEFFKKGDSVRTASQWQVRQPIYQTSKMRWVNYARYLESPAKRIWPYLSPTDIALFHENGVNIKPLTTLDKLTRRLFN